MDLDIYTTEMSKSIWDKAFFMDKIPGVKCVIDFGCADGAMIRYLAPLFPEIMFIGYDISRELIDRALSTPPFSANLTYFTEINNLEDFIWEHNLVEENLCINFSSVLHEMFSSTGGLDVIQTLVGKFEPRYITIRDMYCDDPVPFVSEEHLKIFDILSEEPFLRYTLQFRDKFGMIKDWRDLTHLMMKLQWINNGWEEELKEDYFSWNIYDFITSYVPDYIPAFECRYQLAYLSEMWKIEYNWYNPDIHTHAQFILRRNV